LLKEPIMTDNIKVGLAVLAATAWGGLAYSGLTPVQDFIEFLKVALVSLGAYGMTITDPKK